MDLWFEKRIRRQCEGASYMVRYADDAVFCFQYENEAKEFYQQLIVRLKEFNLEIAEEKTKIINLGKSRDDNNDSDTGNFDFLGFTHYADMMHNGQIVVKRKTSKKKYKASLLKVKEWLKKNRHSPTKELMKMLKIKLHGYCRYYGVTSNKNSISDFIDETKRLLYKWLNRRSQRKSFDWSRFNLFLKKYPLPRAYICVNIFELGVGKSYVM